MTNGNVCAGVEDTTLALLCWKERQLLLNYRCQSSGGKLQHMLASPLVLGENGNEYECHMSIADAAADICFVARQTLLRTRGRAHITLLLLRS